MKTWDVILVEVQPGVYNRHQPISVVDNGNGTWSFTMNSTSATVIQNDAKAYYGISQGGTHPFNGYNENWIVPRLPQSEKAKLVA